MRAAPNAAGLLTNRVGLSLLMGRLRGQLFHRVPAAAERRSGRSGGEEEKGEEKRMRRRVEEGGRVWDGMGRAGQKPRLCSPPPRAPSLLRSRREGGEESASGTDSGAPRKQPHQAAAHSPVVPSAQAFLASSIPLEILSEMPCTWAGKAGKVEGREEVRGGKKRPRSGPQERDESAGAAA